MALTSLTSANITTYMSQWLATATNGNVTSDFAADMMRMTLVCKECGARLEVDRPESAEKIDYSLQEYVKLHRHQGGHANANQKLKELNAEIEKVNTELKAKKIQLASVEGVSDQQPLIPSWNKDKGIENAEIVYKKKLQEAIQQNEEQLGKIGKIIPIDVNSKQYVKAWEKYQKLMELAKGLPTTGIDSQPKSIPKPPEPPKPKPLSTPTGRKFR